MLVVMRWGVAVRNSMSTMCPTLDVIHAALGGKDSAALGMHARFAGKVVMVVNVASK